MSSRTIRRRPDHRAQTHLVLVRGGLDAAAGTTSDKDWRAFCDRIGWHPAEPAIPDDYEDRLAQRLFGDAPAAADPVRASWVAPVPRQRRRPSSRAPLAFVVAALVGVAAAALVPLLTRSSTPVPAGPDPAATQASTTQTNERAPEPSRSEPDRCVSEERDEPKPAPELVGPKPNGSRLARVARARGAARPAGRASGRTSPAADDHVTAALHEPEGRERDAYSDFAPSPPPLPATTLAWSSPARADWRAPVPARVASPASVTDWSLSPGGDRWYGASLPPSSAPIDAANAGAIGVMAKVDFAKLAAF